MGTEMAGQHQERVPLAGRRQLAHDGRRGAQVGAKAGEA